LRKAFLGGIDLPLRSGRLLLESVQHVDGIRAPGHVDHAESAALVRDANLLGTLANSDQRLEIVVMLPRCTLCN